MTNEQKFKSAPARREAYTQYVERCKKANLASMDEFVWLNLEYGDDELKPCPFCGGEAKILVGTERLAICTKCGANTESFEHEVDAIAAWNRRV